MKEDNVKKLKVKKIIALSLIAIIILPLLITLISYFTGYEIYNNVYYYESDSNVMDIYIPKKAYKNKSNGCVLFIHGGSWTGGDKKEESLRCRLLASKGYISATMNYTLHSEENKNEYTVFKVLDEIDLAIIKIKEVANSLGITVDKVATSGYSAGAHLSMLYAFSRGENTPLKVVFTSNMAGPADFSTDIWGEDITKIIVNRLTGKDVTTLDNNLVSLISPTSYINENTPPSIIMQGEKDNVVPPKNAYSVIEKFEKYGVEHKFISLKNSDHSLIQNPFKHITYYNTLLDYCKKYF